ncbi:MAG: hypothetical protein V1886_00090 [archaeon]
MAVEIGRQYQITLSMAVSMYKHGFFEEESRLLEQANNLSHPIVCYSRTCLKRIEEKHILIKNDNGKGEEKLRFHKKCIDTIAKESQSL